MLQIVNQKNTDTNNLLTYYEGFSFRGHYMIVTEILGQNLYDYSMDPLFIGMPRDMLKTVASQMLNAMKHLRDIRIIHGDLKPENIVFTDESRKNIKLIDFGIAQPESRLIHNYV